MSNTDLIPPGGDDDLRLLAESARDFAMIVTGEKGDVVRWSRGAEHVTGWAEAEARGESIDRIFTPEDRAAGVPAREREAALRGGRAEDERWHVKKDGTRFWGSGVMTPLYDPETGALRGFGKVLRDTTSHKRAEDERRAAEALTRGLAANLPGGAVFVVDRDLRYLLAEGRALRGPPAPAVTGKTVSEALAHFGPDFVALVEGDFRRVLGGGTFAREHAMNGRTFLTHGAPLRDGSGRVYAALAVSYDITERKRIEDAARASEAQLSAIFARAAVGLSEIGLDGRFVRVNDELCRLLGRPREEVLTLGVPDVTHPDDIPPSVAALERAIREDIPASLDKRYLRPDGTVVWANSIATVLRDADGRPRSFLVVTADLTTRKEAQFALERLNETLEARVAARTADLMGALGALEAALKEQTRAIMERRALQARLGTSLEEERRRLSRDLHDNMGQHLAALTLGLKSLEGDLTRDRDRRETRATLDRLREIAGRMGRDIHRIAIELRPTALDDLGLVPSLRSYVEEWARQTGVPAAFEDTGVGATRLPMPVETAIYRVVQEALTNAAKYAVPRGMTRLSVTLQRRGDRVQVTVEDDGPGFDLEEAARSGRLGLAGMGERAELAGGKLEVESAPGEGTTIYLRLPI